MRATTQRRLADLEKLSGPIDPLQIVVRFLVAPTKEVTGAMAMKVGAGRSPLLDRLAGETVEALEARAVAACA